MINVRELIKKEGAFPFNVLVGNKRFCSLFGVPDFYFESIGEYVENKGKVDDGNIILLPKVDYVKRGKGMYTLSDETENLEGRFPDFTLVDRYYYGIDEYLAGVPFCGTLYDLRVLKKGDKVSLDVSNFAGGGRTGYGIEEYTGIDYVYRSLPYLRKRVELVKKDVNNS